jgi:hypothetical protein
MHKFHTSQNGTVMPELHIATGLQLIPSSMSVTAEMAGYYYVPISHYIIIKRIIAVRSSVKLV